MKKQIAGLVAWLIAFQLQAVEKVEVKVTSAIVYNSGAEVTYSGTIQLKKGVTEFESSKLNITSATPEIQVKVAGDHELWSSALNVMVAPEVMEMNAYEEQLGFEVDSLRKIAEQWKSTLLLIGYNRVLGSENTSATVAAIKQQLDLVRLKSVEMWNALNQLEVEITSRQQKQEQSLAKRAREATYSVATGKIYSETGGSAKLSLKIFTYDAGWTPKYTFFSYPTTQKLIAKLSAEVWQGTGDSWKAVKLTFSTGKPSESLKLPELKTAYVSKEKVANKQEAEAFVKPDYYLAADTLPLSVMASRIFDQATMISTLENNQPMPTSAIWKTGIFPNPGPYAFTTTNSYDLNGDGTPDYLTSGYGYRVVDKKAFASNFSAVSDSTYLSGNTFGWGSLNNSFKLSSPNQNGSYSLNGSTQAFSAIAAVNSYFSIEDDAQQQASNTIVQEYVANGEIDLRSVALTTQVALKTDTLPVTYSLKVFPNNSRNAFNAAELVNWGKYNFLEADAEIFENDVRKGRLHFNPLVSSDTMPLNLGTNATISSSERMLKDYVSKQTFGSDYRLLVFEISVKNLGNQTQTVTATQSNLLQYLFGNTKTSMENTDFSEPVELSGGVMDENQMIHWQLTLKPGETQKRIVAYKVKAYQTRNYNVY